MYFIDLIAVIIFIFILRNHGARLGALEKSLKGKDVVNKVIAPSISAGAPIIGPVVGSIASEIKPATSIPTSIQQEQKPVVPIVASEESYGRIIGRIGIGAVLIGVAFFLNYAFANNWVGPAGRVMIGVLFGLAFLGVGQYVRAKYLTYSDLLMGGGIAILYLSVFFAYSSFGLIDSLTAGFFMLAVTALAFVMSIVNATQTLALVAIIGGFATPFLVSNGGDMMMELFVYTTILNLGVLAISLFKKWPKLLAVSFAGTAITFVYWFASYYRPEALALTLFYIFITFIIFLIASVSRVIATGTKADAADYFILGANAFGLAVFGYSILKPLYSSVLGFFAVFIAIIYVLVAYLANKYNRDDKALNIFLPGLAVTFLSIAVPLQLSGPWITAAWLIESFFLYVIASTIGNRGFQVMGVIVFSLGVIGAMSLVTMSYVSAGFIPIFNSQFIIFVLVVIVAYAIAYMYKRFGSTTANIQKNGLLAFIIIANIFTVATLTIEINKYYSANQSTVNQQYSEKLDTIMKYNANNASSAEYNDTTQAQSAEISSIKNVSNTLVSVVWALYAALLIGIGFGKRIPAARTLGFVLFILTAIKVLFDVWSLGQLYRIISFIIFGIIALVVSFAYAKYKDRLNGGIV